MTLNPFKLYARWIKLVFRTYDRVAISPSQRVLLKREDGSYTTAGWKGQVIGNLVIQGYICLIAYGFWRKGKQDGAQETLAEMDLSAFDADEAFRNGYNAGLHDGIAAQGAHK